MNSHGRDGTAAAGIQGEPLKGRPNKDNDGTTRHREMGLCQALPMTFLPFPDSRGRGADGKENMIFIIRQPAICMCPSKYGIGHDGQQGEKAKVHTTVVWSIFTLRLDGVQGDSLRDCSLMSSSR